MKAYKGFNKELACTRGKGTYQYEVGKTYEEDSARCASTGFHCCEEPIEILSWYRGTDARYCIVEASGDIHEDGTNKISCTKMTILKEITLRQLGALECAWVEAHPERSNSDEVKRNKGYAEENDIVIVRGKNPKAAGGLNSTLFLLKEEKGGKNIEEVGIHLIDGVRWKPGVDYDVRGRRVKCAKKN